MTRMLRRHFRHPELGYCFTASIDWVQLNMSPRPEFDKSEAINPATISNVSMFVAGLMEKWKIEFIGIVSVP